MIKFKTSFWGVEIYEIEIEKETEKCVWVTDSRGGKPKRTIKFGAYRIYWDTWDDARSHLIQRTRSKINSLIYQLEQEESKLSKIIGMRQNEK